MKKSIILGILIIIILSFCVSASVDYTKYTKTVCDNGVCNQVIYPVQNFAVEDGTWKSMDKLKSWKNTDYKCVVNYDGQNDAACIDFNATTRVISLKQTKETKSTENVPVVVWEPKAGEDPKKISKKDTAKINIKSQSAHAFSKESRQKVLTIDAAPKDVIEIGANSTTIYITSSDNKADITLYDGSGPGKYGMMELWNISSIPIGSTITAAEEYIYLVNKYGSPNMTLKISRTGDAWSELSLTATILALSRNDTDNGTHSLSGNTVNTKVHYNIESQLNDCFNDASPELCSLRTELFNYPLATITTVTDNLCLKLGIPTSVGYRTNDREGSCGPSHDSPYNYLNITYTTASCTFPTASPGQYICEYGYMFLCIANSSDNYGISTPPPAGAKADNFSVAWQCTGTCVTDTPANYSDVYTTICLNATYAAGDCRDTSVVDSLKCDGVGSLFTCQADGNWLYLDWGYDCIQHTGFMAACKGNVTPVYQNNTLPTNYTVLCEPEIPSNCSTEVVLNGWECVGTGVLKQCNAAHEWVNYATENCGEHTEYSGDCNNTYSNETNAVIARTTLCAVGITFPPVTTTTTLAWSNTDNAITRGLGSAGLSFGISSLIIWLILMLVVGGGCIYYTHGSGATLPVLLGAEIFMLVLGGVLTVIPMGIIILIVVIGAGMGAFYVHKLVTGSSGG